MVVTEISEKIEVKTSNPIVGEMTNPAPVYCACDGCPEAPVCPFANDKCHEEIDQDR